MRDCPPRFFLGISILALACILVLNAPATRAQDAIEATTTSLSTSQSAFETTTSPAAPIEQTPASNSTVTSEPRNVPLTRESEFSSQPRRLEYELQINVRGVYDDNINISQTNRVSDYYFSIEPTLTVGAGEITGQGDNFIRLDYFPALFLFVDHSENDAFQQVIHLQGQHRFGRLTLSVGEDISILDGTDLRTIADQTAPGGHPNLDVSSRTKFQTYNTRLGASYDLSGKTFLSTDFTMFVTDYNSASLFSSASIAEDLFINYRYSDKIVIGIGGTGGYQFVENPNPDQTFEQANARVSYQATGKISFNFVGGVEFRQFQNDSRGQYVSPVFDLSASYQLTDSTQFTLTGSRRTQSSGVLAGQDFSGTVIDVGFRQRFFQRFYFGVSGGYENSDYFSTINGATANRQDNYYFVEPSLGFSITRFWNIGGYYLHRQNDSSASFGFDDNQFGFRTGLLF